LAAEIDVSASSNSSPVSVAVYADGSAVRTLGAQLSWRTTSADHPPKSFPAGSPEVVAFLADLAAVGDVSTIPTTNCIKSVSFGTTTSLTANGNYSGDLECPLNPSTAQQALINDCEALLQ
jgi:hypothetical protein